MDDSKEYPESCRREFYRLRYPLLSRPTLQSSRIFLVAELSEQGLRLVVPKGEPKFDVEPGQPISGRLNLPSANLDIYGKAKRWNGQEITVVEVEGLSFQILLEEQRRLIKTHPWMKLSTQRD